MKTRSALPFLLAGFALSAQALTPGSGTWIKESASYGSPNLQDAYVYVPANASPAVRNGKRALMLSLHGCGQTASGNVINKKFNWETTAEQYGMVVVAPTVPSGSSATRSVSGCWDWFGTGWTRTNRDQVPLKKLIDSLLSRGLDIDPKQVYVSGLSAGGGETIIMGCAFPDVFAGMGISAGPALGSTSGDISMDPKVSASQVAANCKAANGNNYNSHFASQIASVVYGANDYFVKNTHGTRNAEGLRSLYGTAASATTFTVAGGGNGKEWKDGNGQARVTEISVAGMAHAWPAGSGGSGGGSYVSYAQINYPAHVTAWLFQNNLRVGPGGEVTTTTAATTTSTAATTTSTKASTTTTKATTTTTKASTTTTAKATTTTSQATTTTTKATTTSTASTTTTTKAASAGACFNSSNLMHVWSGRAYDVFGTAYALGSNQKMGLDSFFAKTKLRQKAWGFYVIDSTCP